MQATATRPSLIAGDTVIFDFGHNRVEHTQIVRALILEVRERYAKVNHGKTPQGPVLKYRNLDTGTEAWADQSWITKIESRGPGPRLRRNIFAEDAKRMRLVWRESSGVMFGSLPDLVAHCLASLNREFTRPIDNAKVRELFDKQKPGYLGRLHPHSFVIRVREKPFRAWVLRNQYRFITTIKKLVEAETANQLAIEADYWSGVEADMDREAQEDQGDLPFYDDDDTDARDMQEQLDLRDIMHDVAFGFPD